MQNTLVFVAASAIAFCSITAISPQPPAALAETESLVVVVAQAFPANDISLATLKTAFRGRAVHVDGKPFVPINHQIGSAMRVEFDRLVLGLEPAAVGRYWVDQRIRDEGSPPKTVPTAELAVRVVAALPNAVTYARPSLLNPKVKAVKIDGKGAGQPGYALTPAR